MEVNMIYFTVLSHNFLGEQKYNHRKYPLGQLVLQAVICTCDLPNTKQQC